MSCLSSVPEKCLELFRKGSLASVKDPFSFSYSYPCWCYLATFTGVPRRAVNLAGIAHNRWICIRIELLPQGGIITIKGDVRSLCCS